MVNDIEWTIRAPDGPIVAAAKAWHAALHGPGHAANASWVRRVRQGLESRSGNGLQPKSDGLQP